MSELTELSKLVVENNTISGEEYAKWNVKKGLREDNGEGVLVGLTNISKVIGHTVSDSGEIIPADGQLFYRGVNINDIVARLEQNQSLGYEEVAYLLLFGKMPTTEQYQNIRKIFAEKRELPVGFISNVLLTSPTENIMSQMSKALLALSAYDENLHDLSIENVLSQCLNIISILPRFSVYSYLSHNYFNNGKSLHIHYHNEKLTLAENFLQMLRIDAGYSDIEARLLDLCLILQMEHGGGNNSTFTTRVVSSAGADTYMTMTAALSALSGPKHGGANLKVHKMMKDLQKNVKDLTSEKQVTQYLEQVLDKQAFDNKGIIYGIGHPVYTITDPRATILKRFAKTLATEKNSLDEFELYERVAKIALKLVEQKTRSEKPRCINVDFYIGLVYSMLNIPEELYTPLFAMSRCVGWSAHRLEELTNSSKIIRPAYQSI
jgi:citrate synthase